MDSKSKILLLVISCSLCFFGIGKSTEKEIEPVIPEVVISRADAYFIDHLGETYYREHFSLVEVKSREPSECDNVNAIFKVPHFAMTWRIEMPDHPFVRHYVHIIVSEDGTSLYLPNSGGLPDCVTYPIECEFPIDEQQAIDFARRNGFPAGLKPWKARFVWSKQYYTYAWAIMNTTALGDGKYSGNTLYVDANTGDVYLPAGKWFAN